MRKRFAELTVLDQHEIAPELFHARFQLPEDNENAVSDSDNSREVPSFLPGNFLMLRCEPADPYRLMRPMSVLAFDRAARTIDILYSTVGDQTRRLSLAPPGTRLPAVFPLGNHFDIPQEKSTLIVLVAGGVGLPPLLFLASHLGEHGFQRPALFVGARDDSQLARGFIERWSADSHFATDDGSQGFRGTVVDHLEAEGVLAGAWVYACGPRAMLRRLQGLFDAVAPARCQVSLEEMMACGTGACYGCAVGSDAQGMEAHQLVCRDGPVFELAQVRFD